MKSHPRLLLFLMTFCIHSFIWAQESQDLFRWDLQVTDPDFELVNYKLEKKAFKPYLKKTGWRCEATQTEEKGPRRLKKLICDFSIEKAGVVTTIVSCSEKRPYSEGFLELFDERKNITFQVMLTCRKNTI